MELRHPQLGPIYNALDMPVRFLFSRAGIISTVLNRAVSSKLYASKYRDIDQHVGKVERFLAAKNIRFAGKTVLELGPGNSYITAYAFLLRGAKRVIQVDKFSRHSAADWQQEQYRAEVAYLKANYPKKRLTFLDEHDRLKPGYVTFIASELTELTDLPPIDIIYSSSVLEHIKDVSANVQAMFRVLRPGGVAYHDVDLRDHYNFAKPFLFYKYSEAMWNRWLTKEGLSYTNRWRYDELMEAFQEAGFRVLREKVRRWPLPPGQGIDARFARSSALTIGTMMAVFRKPRPSHR